MASDHSLDLNLNFPSLWYRSGCPTPSPEQVVIYQLPNLGGNCRVLDVGMYPDFGAFSPVGDDAVSSLEMGTNTMVTLYQHGNYGGRNVIREGARIYLNLDDVDFENRTSSMKVLKR